MAVIAFAFEGSYFIHKALATTFRLDIALAVDPYLLIDLHIYNFLSFYV
jgi:hypothetical protein